MAHASLTVYIPTWGRPDACLQQVYRLADQRDALVTQCQIVIVVSVNGDPTYKTDQFMQAGADIVIQRPLNLGGNANICLGYEYLQGDGFLWILSDDDPILDTALKTIMELLTNQQDLDAIFFSDTSSAERVTTPRSVDDVTYAPLPAISCTVYKGSAFEESVEAAFRSIVTHFPHLGLIDSALAAGTLRSIWAIPISQVVDLSAMRQEAESLGRSAMGRHTGAFFFGGGLTTYLDQDPVRRRYRTRRWWRTHWHRLSMYRLARSPEGMLIEAAGRGNLRTYGWWLMSLPPWWRLKNRISLPTREPRRLPNDVGEG